MNLNIFIKRPVLSTVISVIILLLGVISMLSLPVTQYPDIAPPAVEIKAQYPGANAEKIRESVIIPIEEQVNGVEGMTYISSTASNDGNATITVFFEQGYNADIAAVNVQNRVAAATSSLPATVNTYGVTTQKVQNSAIMYVALASKNKEYDETFIMNYMNINVKPELLRINGVSKIDVFGARDYSMRIWIKPEKMAGYELSVNDVIAAINEQSKEVATGALGQNAGEAFEYVIKYKGRLNEVEEYENIILGTGEKGEVLRLKDVATIELDAFSYSGVSKLEGQPCVAFGVYQTPGSNAQKIADELYSELDKVGSRLPEGMHFDYLFDTNRFLDASMSKVKSSLVMAFILVILVMYLFLQNFRSTIVPSIAVPVAIIGTFFFLQLVGFSLNLLTLFAMILAIGIVVDNAIVVVEAVYTKLESGYSSAREATESAMGEITGALISGTLVMIAVFLPVTFMGGPSGIFYKQFGIILMVSILISAVNALTLSPALTAMFMKPNEKMRGKSIIKRFFALFNKGFDKLTAKYVKALKFFLKNRWATIAVFILSGIIIYTCSLFMPSGFVPTEDQSVVFVNIELPEGASLDRTVALNNKLEKIFKSVYGIENVSLIAGSNFFSGAGSSYAMGFLKLKDWDERTEDYLSIDGIMGQLYGLTASVSEAQIIFITPPTVPGFGSSDGIEAQLVDMSNASNQEFDRVSKEYMGRLMQSDPISFVSGSFNIRFPQYEMDVNVEKAKEAKVRVSEIFSTVQGYIGGTYAGDFSKFGKQYKVMLQSKPDSRNEEASLGKIMVKNDMGKMAPLTSFVDLKKVNGPQTVKRFNLHNAITLNGIISRGASTGDGIKAFKSIAEKDLPNNYEVVFSGLTREEEKAGNKAIVIFALSLVFVYFLLAAQYESFILPLSVILPMIVGVAGAFVSNFARGLDNNIFFQIGLIMLIGLLSKNAILIVEISLQKRKQGYSLMKAALEGSKLRLRPILMTSFTFIIGLIPLVFASGVGAKGNQSIGTGAAGGMLIGTIIGLLVIPVLFVFFQWLQEKMVVGEKVNS